ncbi:hypothetical protein BGX38DRAFT_880972 [Terfezia claveryi]|nr:hypothetical protein BGX38DRAFT_880972 [Terfezia claveryi]
MPCCGPSVLDLWSEAGYPRLQASLVIALSQILCHSSVALSRLWAAVEYRETIPGLCFVSRKMAWPYLNDVLLFVIVVSISYTQVHQAPNAGVIELQTRKIKTKEPSPQALNHEFPLSFTPVQFSVSLVFPPSESSIFSRGNCIISGDQSLMRGLGNRSIA